MRKKKIPPETDALLEKLEVLCAEYEKAEYIAARGNAKPFLTMWRFAERNLAQDFISRIKRGARFTDADWQRERDLLLDTMLFAFDGSEPR